MTVLSVVTEQNVFMVMILSWKQCVFDMLYPVTILVTVSEHDICHLV